MLNINEKTNIVNINTKSSLKTRLNDLGCIKGTKVQCLFKSPFGDPSAYLIKGAVIAMRKDDTSKIEITDDEDV